MSLDGVLAALGVKAPYIVQQLVPGEDLAGVGEQLIEQLELLFGQLQHLLPPGDGVGAGVQHHRANDDPPLAGDMGPAEQGIDPPGQLLIVHRLCHVVVHAGGEAPALVLEGLLGGEKQHRDAVALVPQGLDQGIAVHPGHHHIGDDQIHGLPLQQLQSLHAVLSADDGKLMLQLGAGKQAHGGLVLHQQDGCHLHRSFVSEWGTGSRHTHWEGGWFPKGGVSRLFLIA